MLRRCDASVTPDELDGIAPFLISTLGRTAAWTALRHSRGHNQKWRTYAMLSDVVNAKIDLQVWMRTLEVKMMKVLIAKRVIVGLLFGLTLLAVSAY
jgi:hypothetical protein